MRGCAAPCNWRSRRSDGAPLGGSGALQLNPRKCHEPAPPHRPLCTYETKGCLISVSAQPRLTPLPLTPAQVRLALKIADGLDTAQSAFALAITSGTVNVQLASMGRKLGVSGRAAVIHAAYVSRQIPRPEQEEFDGDFTEAEIQMWRLVASGATVQRIADVCRVSRATARVRIRLLRRRVKASNDPHLVTLGWRYGVVDESLIDMAPGLLIAVPLRG
jgi:DNA-binding CsgD family transcriptional regulator